MGCLVVLVFNVAQIIIPFPSPPLHTNPHRSPPLFSRRVGVDSNGSIGTLTLQRVRVEILVRMLNLDVGIK